jgi:23S rRNA maturation-related 3'-5' exoribonuclease YhaM
LKAENSKLESDFPSVFYKHADDELDATFFEMLQLKRRIERGELTNEQASTLMGQQLFGR